MAKILGWLEVVVAGVAMLVALYLLASPLVPRQADIHGGMLAFFSGLFLLVAGASLIVPGVALLRAHRLRWWAQAFPAVVCLLLVILLR